MNFENYMDDVRSQLVENTTGEYKSEHVTYHYSSKLVNKHLDYFKECMEASLSSYKALLFFGDYLKDAK